LKKTISPAAAAVIIVVVVVLIAIFGYSRMNRSGLSKAEEEKYLKPLQLGPGSQLPAPPQPAARPGLPGPGPGGANMPMPPPPPR